MKMIIDPSALEYFDTDRLKSDGKDYWFEYLLHEHLTPLMKSLRIKEGGDLQVKFPSVIPDYYDGLIFKPE